MNTNYLSEFIGAMLVRLHEPLSDDDIANGWSENAASAMRLLLVRMKDSLKSEIPIQSLSITRGLDHWGVQGGELFERLAELNIAYNEWGLNFKKNARRTDSGAIFRE